MYINSYCIIYPYIEHTYEPIITAFFPPRQKTTLNKKQKKRPPKNSFFTDDPKIKLEIRKVFT